MKHRLYNAVIIASALGAVHSAHAESASELQRRYMQPQSIPLQPSPPAYAPQPAILAPAAGDSYGYSDRQPHTMYQVPAYQMPSAQPTAAYIQPARAYTANDAQTIGSGDGYIDTTRGGQYAINTLPKAYGNGTQFEGSVGYRTATLDWNIAGDSTGQNPNILSELSWETTMVEARGGIRHTIPDGFLRQGRLEASGFYAQAVSGDTQDSDYSGDNRTNEFSRSNNNAEGSHAWGAKLAVGYEIPFVDTSETRVIATPLIGYDYNNQKMRSTDGNQTVCDTSVIPGCTLGAFGGLNSHYAATWKGGFLGMEGEVQHGSHRLRARGEFEAMDYTAEARWNLRNDLAQDPSFRHEASGTGVTILADYAYLITPSTNLVLSGEWNEFTADTDGRDTTYLAGGGSGTTALNEVNWSSQAYRVGMEQKF